MNLNEIKPCALTRQFGYGDCENIFPFLYESENGTNDQYFPVIKHSSIIHYTVPDTVPGVNKGYEINKTTKDRDNQNRDSSCIIKNFGFPYYPKK